jgi:c-di-GMP-binding flagellar brake protein YcgR
MQLSSMVVSRDLQEVSVLECILSGLQMDVAIEAEPQRVLSRLSKSKVDALIVDCDLNGSFQLLRDLHSPDGDSKAIPLVLMGRSQQIDCLNESGAMFTFTKPISVERAVHTLSAARSMILDERLRYQRTSLDVPVSFKCKGQESGTAKLVNLSQNGMQIHMDRPFVDRPIKDRAIEAAPAIQVSFELPGARRACQAQAEIVWQDNTGNLGLRFVKIAPQLQRALQLWLAQQFLAN